MRWQVYVHDTEQRSKLVSRLLDEKFDVYLWRNSNRVTFETKSASRVTMFFLKHKIPGNVVKNHFPNPGESDLSYKVTKIAF
jgi:ABC-type lipoprotein release transport system permease subunit